MSNSAVRPLAGLATVVVVVAVIGFAVGMFQGDFTKTSTLR